MERIKEPKKGKKKVNKTKPSQKKIKKARKKNPKLIVFLIIVLIIVIIALVKVLPRTKSIEVKIITNGEESKITKEDALKLSGLKTGDKLYKDLRSQIEEKIETNPYVKKATVSRNINGKITIEVTQREPSYLINYSGEFIYIDNEGYILEVNTNSNGKPILIGLTTDFSGLSIGNTKIRLNNQDLEKLKIVNDILQSLKSNDIQNTITSVDVSDEKNFILNLDNDGKQIYIGDGSDLPTKALYIKKILETESGHNGIIYINGNLDEGYVYFREQ